MYSPQYKALQEQFHRECDSYGISGHKYADAVLKISQGIDSREILDYGAGKCTLQKALPFPITCYDPFIPELAKEPQPHDIVVCSDVMEHIEPEHIEAVIQDIARLTKRVVFFQIATRLASKTLPDGRNAHLVVEPVNWWLSKYLLPHFQILSCQVQNGGFIFYGQPLPTP